MQISKLQLIALGGSPTINTKKRIHQLHLLIQTTLKVKKNYSFFHLAKIVIENDSGLQMVRAVPSSLSPPQADICVYLHGNIRFTP